MIMQILEKKKSSHLEAFYHLINPLSNKRSDNVASR